MLVYQLLAQNTIVAVSEHDLKIKTGCEASPKNNHNQCRFVKITSHNYLY
jgi:hypothetical protein